MSDKTKKPALSREERLAAELRANLRRRKAAMRKQKASSKDDAPKNTPK